MQNTFAVKFLDPYQIIRQLEISKNTIAADFGCGPGYFSIPLAQTLPQDGLLYAIDVLPQALEAVESQAKILGINNIKTVRANLESPGSLKISGNSIDLVIIKDVLFQNKNRKAILQEAKRVLKPNGRLLAVEWRNEDASIGPEMNIRISKEELEQLIVDGGFIINKDIDAGDFHYGILATK